MDAFWPEFEKRGYKTVRAFTDQSNFSDDELKEMGMGKVKIQYFRRVLKKNAAQNFLSFTQGLLSDDEDAKPTAPDEKFTADANGSLPGSFEDVLAKTAAHKDPSPFSSSSSASNSLSGPNDAVPVADAVSMTSAADRSAEDQSNDLSPTEEFRSFDVIERDNLHEFLVTYKLEKFEPTLVAQGLSDLTSLSDKDLATNELLAACGLGALETRKLRVFISKYKSIKPSAFSLPATENGAGIPSDESMLSVGDFVTWKGSDDELPAGTVGKITQIHHEDGDAECLFETAAGLKIFTFAMKRLNLVLAIGDSVVWKGSDDELPAGTIGKVVHVFTKDGEAQCLFDAVAGPKTFTFSLTRLKRVASPASMLSVGDSVVWKGSDDELPAGTMGKVVHVFEEDGEAECLFETATGSKTFTFAMTRLARMEVPDNSIKHPFWANEKVLRAKYADTLKSRGLNKLDKAAFRELVTKIFKENFQDVPEMDWPKDKDLDAAFAATDQNKHGGISENAFLALIQVIIQGGVKDMGKLKVFSKSRATFKKTYMAVFSANILHAQEVAASKLVKWRRLVVARRSFRRLEEMRSFLELGKLASVVDALAAHGIASVAALQDPNQATDAVLEACMNKLELRRLRAFLAKHNGVTVFSPASARISSENAALRASSEVIASSELIPARPKRGMVAGLFGDVDRSSLQRYSLDVEEGAVSVSPESMTAIPEGGMVAGLFGEIPQMQGRQVAEL